VGDDQYVAVARRQRRGLQGIAQDAREVVARPDRRDARYRCKRNGGGSRGHEL
jgi:hypothetical protein